MASKFLAPIYGEVMDNGDIKLTQSFQYYREGNKEDIITVPEGFESDWASIPQALQLFISKVGKHSKPAILHDYLCVMNHKDKSFISRKEADEVFLEAMKIKGVNLVKRYIMYAAVRVYAIFARIK